MSKWLVPGTAVLLLVLAGGCGLSFPRLRAPGNVAQQRYNASIYDPYPDVDVGPEVVGGRPRDFQNPMPSEDRSRWLWNKWSQR